MPAKRLISVVIPAYNEEANVEELHKRLSAVFESQAAFDFEVVIVENGSHDKTWEKLVEVHRRDPRFKVVRLSRNFRADGGLTAGLQYVKGDACVLMTADLQDPPEMIPPFIAKWQEGYENVYGIVTRRRGTSLVRRFNSEVFYWIINKLTRGLFPRNASDFRLVDRRVYESVNLLEERNRFMRGLFVWTGFRSVGIEHERPPRFAGETKASTLHVMELALKAIFAYTYLPLQAITVSGIALSLFAFSLLSWQIYKAFAHGVPYDGFGTLIGVILLMFGCLFVFLGVISQYVGLIYEEVKQRPNYIVRELLGVK